MSHIEPFIRWAGGKTWLVPFMKQLTQDLKYKNYYEPFLGGAAVFFSLTPPKHAYLSDINAELIDTYTAIRDIPDDVLQALQLLQNTEEDYYRIRETEPTALAERAARFLYLNQTSFNGLYRVNNQGKYNVPYHRGGDPYETGSDTPIPNFLYLPSPFAIMPKVLSALSCAQFAVNAFFIWLMPAFLIHSMTKTEL